jgi:site-specific recombinase XerD
MTLIFDEYIQKLERVGQKPQTVRSVRSALKAVDQWFVGNGLDPTQADQVAIEELVASMRNAGYAPNTIRFRIVNTKAAYNYAVERGVMQKQPVPNKLLKAAPDVEPEVLSYEQLRRVYENCETLRERLAFHLLTFAGLRASEMLSLQWNDIDFEGRRMKINGKGDKIRWVPLALELQSILKLADSVRAKNSSYVIENTTREEDLSYPQFHKVWSKVLSNAGIRLEQPCHSFRKTLASELYRQGVATDTIDKILGWSPSVVRTRYYQAMPDDLLYAAICKAYQTEPIT